MNSLCRLSGKPLVEVINLGDLHVSNFVETPDSVSPHGPLRIGIGEESGLLQLMDSVERESLYRTYWYRSGTNHTMKRQLGDVLRTAKQWISLREGDTILDIGCNDGTLLNLASEFGRITRIGIDPAQNLAEEAMEQCEKHHTGYFSKEVFAGLSDGASARLITTIAMFYGLEDPLSFVRDLRECLAPDGIWILQLSYTPLMLKQNAFDNICHEHVEYYTLTSLRYLLSREHLKILDVDFNDANAGSFRVVITHEENQARNSPLFVRDIGNFRIQATLEYEATHEFDNPEIYRNYMTQWKSQKVEMRKYLEELKSKGKRILGYGASTKGNTLLQYYGLGPDLIEAIVERQSQKWGLFTAGSVIPIISEEEGRAMKPDYFFVLPWHFIEEFITREANFVARGGKFIVPLPELQSIPERGTEN